jgi:LysM repeat protein
VTSPLPCSTDRAPRTARRWLGRFTTTVGTATAVTVLLGTPVGGPAQTASEPAAEPATGTELRLVSAKRHRWPGHPGRAIVRYRVKPGDTATGLAVRFHAWTRELRAINHLGRQGHLYVGQRIRIPVVLAAVRKQRQAHQPHTARKPRQRATRPRSVKPWRNADASRATVRSHIVRSARGHGVPPTLALAISWQESGWQQRRISSAGAVGAMQVMPDTGRWMSLYAGRRLNIYGLRDNVTAGVTLIDVLRGETSERRAIAAYYQGLGAVREHGMYPSTRVYVRNVVALRERLRHGWNPS